MPYNCYAYSSMHGRSLGMKLYKSWPLTKLEEHYVTTTEARRLWL